MNIFLYPNADTTIYKHDTQRLRNTGMDEILELICKYSEESGHYVSRIMMIFDLGNPEHLSESNFFLNLKITESKQISNNSEIEVYPIKTKWESGIGRLYDNIENDGANWMSTGLNMKEWENTGCDYFTKEELNSLYGVDRIPTFKFDKRTSDVSFDITEYAELWNSGILENNGVLIKLKNETIQNSFDIKFFSNETNTIYQPYIRIAKDDYIFNPCGCTDVTNINCSYNDNLLSGTLGDNMLSGSNFLSGTLPDDNCENKIQYSVTKKEPTIKYIDTENISVSLVGLGSEISVREQYRIKVNVREKYPKKTFGLSSRYSSNSFVDYPIYYSVVDADTKERVLNFDKYTRVSCNGTGHYFDFDFGCLSIDRIYFFEIRVESENQTKIFEDNIKFKIKR